MSSPSERGPAAEPGPMLPDAYPVTPGSGPGAGGSQPGGTQPGGPYPGGSEPGGPQSDGKGPGGSQPGYGKLLSGAKPLWTDKPGGRTVFRMPAPLVLWWAWVVVALILLVNVLLTEIDIRSLRAVATLLIVTAVMYACTLHSRVETDAEGVTVFNPLLSHRAPWGAVEGIFLGDSVEFSCIRPAPKKPKKIYSWALYSRRRARARSQLQPVLFITSRRVVSNRAPVEAANLAKQPLAQIMAGELGRRAADARERGPAPGFLQTSWAWRSVAAILAPAALLVIASLIS